MSVKGQEDIEVSRRSPFPDPVNHPAHYTGFSHGAEVIDIVENLPYNRGAAIKYLARAGKKAIADEIEDLRKARWYVTRELERLGYGAEHPPTLDEQVRRHLDTEGL